MEHAIESLTRGNVAEVKVVLASVALALGVYQLAVIAVAYGKLELGPLEAKPAGWAHRAVGDTVAVILLLVGATCLAYYGLEDDYLLHGVAGSLLLAVLAVKITVVRAGRAGGVLPVLGLTVFALLAVTWATSAGSILVEG